MWRYRFPVSSGAFRHRETLYWRCSSPRFWKWLCIGTNTYFEDRKLSPYQYLGMLFEFANGCTDQHLAVNWGIKAHTAGDVTNSWRSLALDPATGSRQPTGAKGDII